MEQGEVRLEVGGRRGCSRGSIRFSGTLGWPFYGAGWRCNASAGTKLYLGAKSGQGRLRMTSKQQIGYLVILLGIGAAIAGTVLSVSHPWIAGLMLSGAAAIIVGKWIVKNLS